MHMYGAVREIVICEMLGTSRDSKRFSETLKQINFNFANAFRALAVFS